MTEPLKIRLRKLLPWSLGLFAGGIVLVLAIAYSGIFNIAATAGHPAWMEWLLALGKERSVIVNSKPVDVPELNLTELVPLGAAHFHGGCATCHRMPGQPINPVYDQMLPPPPNLQIHAPMWTRQQLFWMVRHGIQFTGMPSWSGQGRDDEVWAVVAFLQALPLMGEQDYLKYANGNSQVNSQLKNYPANQLAGKGRINFTACDRCHDTHDSEPTSPYVPILGGQDSAYLRRTLHEYRDDLRQSGFMEPIVAELDDKHIDNLAAYYASLKVPVAKSAQPASPAKVEQGRQLAEHGDRSRMVPACLSCHGINKRPDYPRLAGQSEHYIRQQLHVLQKGIRAKTPYGAIMTTIAKRLTEQQAEAAAAFFAGQLPAEHTAAEGLR
jgi:cytochrome c553